MNVQCRKSTNGREGMPKQKFDLSLGTKSLELESVFKEASRNFKCTFLFNNADKKFKTIRACTLIVQKVC
jgi:hypothetical protein